MRSELRRPPRIPKKGLSHLRIRIYRPAGPLDVNMTTANPPVLATAFPRLPNSDFRAFLKRRPLDKAISGKAEEAMSVAHGSSVLDPNDVHNVHRHCPSLCRLRSVMHITGIDLIGARTGEPTGLELRMDTSLRPLFDA